jgi:transposase
VLWFPPLQSAWARRGEPLPVMLGGRNARQVLFGTVHLRSGHRLLLPQVRQRGENFQLFLDVLAWHYRGWHPILLLDEHPAHTAEASLSLAEELGIELLWLPKRAPELNGMDQLWRRAKATVSANRQYDSVNEHMERLVAWLLGLTPEQARQKAGLLSESFWLRECL